MGYANINLEMFKSGLHLTCKETEDDEFIPKGNGNMLMDILNKIDELTNPDTRYQITEKGLRVLELTESGMDFDEACSKVESEEEKEKKLPYEYVDLGLPSGLKWCKTDVGTFKEGDSGLYFAWGETKGYKDTTGEKKFTWEDYKFGKADELSKYNETDGKTVLDPEDDAATVNMGEGWRMPTYDEYQELMDNTTWEWIEDYNYIGCDVMKLTSKINGNYIIFPTHGYCDLGWFNYAGSKCYFWTSSLYTWNIRHGCYIDMDSSGKGFSSGYRYVGQSVRGVRSDV